MKDVIDVGFCGKLRFRVISCFLVVFLLMLSGILRLMFLFEILKGLFMGIDICLLKV